MMMNYFTINEFRINFEWYKSYESTSFQSSRIINWELNGLVTVINNSSEWLCSGYSGKTSQFVNLSFPEWIKCDMWHCGVMLPASLSRTTTNVISYYTASGLHFTLWKWFTETIWNTFVSEINSNYFLLSMLVWLYVMTFNWLCLRNHDGFS